ncbi:MAG TPA: hypothetical protein VJS91_03255, partial [Nitrososphaeraceae archaeon]|nr:hypothetical protein [Nitrososphaeraceae archaeon]
KKRSQEWVILQYVLTPRTIALGFGKPILMQNDAALTEIFVQTFLKTLKLSEYDTEHLSISNNFWNIFE